MPPLLQTTPVRRPRARHVLLAFFCRETTNNEAISAQARFKATQLDVRAARQKATREKAAGDAAAADAMKEDDASSRKGAERARRRPSANEFAAASVLSLTNTPVRIPGNIPMPDLVTTPSHLELA